MKPEDIRVIVDALGGKAVESVGRRLMEIPVSQFELCAQGRSSLLENVMPPKISSEQVSAFCDLLLEMPAVDRNLLAQRMIALGEAEANTASELHEDREFLRRSICDQLQRVAASIAA